MESCGPEIILGSGPRNSRNRSGNKIHGGKTFKGQTMPDAREELFLCNSHVASGLP